MSKEQRERMVDLVVKATGVTRPEARKIVAVAVRKVKAGTLIGVAGFWA